MNERQISFREAITEAIKEVFPDVNLQADHFHTARTFGSILKKLIWNSEDQLRKKLMNISKKRDKMIIWI